MEQNRFDGKDYKRSRKAYIFECAFEYFVALMVSDAFLAELLTSIGMTDSETGIISSFVSLAFLFQLCAVPIVRKVTNTKKFAVLFHSAGQLCFILIFLIPFLAFPKELNKFIVSALLLVAYFGNYMVTSTIYRWGNSFVEPKKLATFSGKKEMISLISGVVIQLAAGAVVNHYIDINNEKGAFIFCAVSIFIYSALDLVMLLLIKNEKTEQKTEKPKIPFREVMKNTLGNKSYAAIVVLACIIKAQQYAIVGFLATYKLRELAMSMLLVQIVNIASHLARFAVSIPIGKYTDRTSYSKGVQLGQWIAVASFLVLVFTCPETWWLIIPYSLIYNISHAGTNANMLNITYSYVDGKYITEAFAIKNAISGIVAFAASVISGKLLEAIQANGGVMLFGRLLYGQQVLAIISLALGLSAILFNRFCVRKLKPINA